MIPEWLIKNNIMITHELLYSVKGKSKGRNGIMAIKLDMTKAYDRVEWGYLEVTLNILGFNNHWRNLIMSCGSTVSYLVLLNGSSGQVFKPYRGLRQGDHLSLYFFLLCAERFCALLNAAKHQGEISGLKVAKRGASVNHLLFADDSILFN